jgi:hypothetical protein
MSALVDMARSGGGQKEPSPLVEQDKYPYGCRIHLEEEELERLGVDETDWEIGDVFPLDVLAKVVSKSANESEGGKAHRSVCLQLTHIGAEEEPEHDEEEQPLAKHGYLQYD